MSQEPTQNNCIPPIYLRMGLLVVLLISGAVILSSVDWIYHRIQSRLGMEIAEVVVAFLMVLIVILILFGFWAGFRAARILRLRKIQTLWVYRLLKRFRLMRSLWRYVEPNWRLEDTKRPMPETITIPERPPRRGRRPTYSLERWIRVVLVWENRNLQQNIMTLSEYLIEQFGTHADGSPKMSENSYYEWKKKVFKELQKREARKKIADAA